MRAIVLLCLMAIGAVAQTIPTAFAPMGTMGSKAGRVPAQYREVAYLESSGTQYIDTGVVPNTNTDVVVALTVLEAGTYAVFGSRYPGSQNSFSVLVFGTQVRFDYGVSSASHSIPFTSVSSVRKYGAQNYVNGISVADNPSETLASTLPLTLFGLNGTSYGAPMQLRTCSIRESNTPVRDFVPCVRTADSVAGMYDLVNGTFATNQGTGTFITGPTVGVSP